MKFILIAFVKAYRLVVSPLIGPNCRFHPTCSAYMIEAIEAHGVLKGGALGVKRLFKCHPFYKGRFLDPIPPLKPAKSIATKEWFSYKHKQLKTLYKQDKNR